MLRGIVLLLALMASQSPSPGNGHKTNYPPNHTQSSQSKAAIVEIPTSSTNSRVIKNTDPNKTESYSYTDARFNNPSTDWWMFGVTAAICLVGILQLFMFNAQLKVMRNTLILSNRPKIIVSNFRLHLQGETIQLPTTGMSIQYCISNKGGTTAKIISNRTALVLGPIPNTLPYEGAKQISNSPSELRAGEFRYCDYDGWEGTSLFEQFQKVIRGRTEGIVLFGFIDFRDEAGGGGRIYFKRKWNPKTHAFERYKNSQKSN